MAAPAQRVAYPQVDRIEAVRRFNRFYTERIGVLHETLLNSEFSLTEVRLLYELAHRDALTATQLGDELGLDAGYVSRILKSFVLRGFLRRAPKAGDGRSSLLVLTARGRKAFAPLDARSREEVAVKLQTLPGGEQIELVSAMQTIEKLLGAVGRQYLREKAAIVLRPHAPGDMGWVISRHAAVYAQEFGWEQAFEALVAEIVAKFIRNFDPKCERCWIAERGGENVGSVFVVRKSKRVAQLRLLLVEPAARGMGIGAQLVAECVRFARAHGYLKIMLGTNDVLRAARSLYIAAGFKLVGQERHRSFGRDLVGQTWEMDLRK